MKFYLVRHGDALSAAENPQRPLSSDGRRRVQQTAGMALERSIQASVIYHSGILRAKETRRSWPKVCPLRQSRNSPACTEDDRDCEGELEAANDSIVLVGHLPQRRLAGLSINGDPERLASSFFPATMIATSGRQHNGK